MNDFSLKITTIGSVLLLICVILYVDVFSYGELQAKGKIEKTEKPEINQTVQEIEIANKEQVLQYNKELIEIPLPTGIIRNDIVIENNMLEKECKIQIPVYKFSIFDQKIDIKGKAISKSSYKLENNMISIQMQLKDVYDYMYYIEDNTMHLLFAKPKELYNKVVLIDAGHGGVGAGSVVDKQQEKDINLSIVLKLKELFEKSSIKAYYTRLEDVGITVYERADLANAIGADLFLSVHSNNFEEDTSVRGTEILYSQQQGNGKYTSKWFAKICNQNMKNGTELKSRGLMAGDDIHIIRNASMPVALVEIGYMTNKEELQYMLKEENQEKIAQALYQSVDTALESLKEK